MFVCAQQCAAVEGELTDGLEIGCCCRVFERGTALLSAIIVHSAAYVMYKRRQRGLREPLGSSKGPYFDGIRGKRRKITRTGCSKRRRTKTHACFEDYVAKDKTLER